MVLRFPNYRGGPLLWGRLTPRFDYGMDNIGSMVDYLFGPKPKKIEWNDVSYSREEFIDLIENNPKEYEKLVDEVEQDWAEVEEAVKPERKSRWE